MPSRTGPASPAPTVAKVLRTSGIPRSSARIAPTRSRVSRREASGADRKLIWNSARSTGVKNSVFSEANAATPPRNASEARARIVFRCPRAHAITARYRSAVRSNPSLNRSRIRATRCRFPVRSMSGSCQRDDSIGSSVNDTKRETSTAKATVIPNWKKNLPTIPFMNATGTKTATMEKVVARTASPISAVPARAASKWSWPCSRCRTMFSRTTIASSMRRPIARDSAISVMTLSVIPMKFMTMKEEMTEIGRVSPVITVERHELRKQKTMKIVRIPPRIRVVWTSSTESRIMIDASRTTSIRVPAGSSGCRRAISLFTSSTTETVFAPDCFWMSRATAGTPFTRARDRGSSIPSTTSATSPSRTGRPFLCPITIAGNPDTSAGFPETRNGNSEPFPVSRPRGVLTFSDRIPAITSSTPIPSASRRAWSMSTLTSRLEEPTRSTFPTPGRFSNRRLTFFSTRVVRSLGGRASDRTARDTIGAAAKSSFWMIGSSIPSGSSPRMAAILARASWAPSLSLTSSWNWTMTVETLSREIERTFFTPAIVLTASSIRLLTSRSTLSGEAPGNFVTMVTTGISTSGNMSTASRL